MINWKPFSPKQKDFIKNSTAKLNVATGSVRAGKTIACTIRWINILLTGPDADYAMLGKSMGTLKRNVINDLFDILGKENARWVDRQQGEMVILGKRVYAIGAATEEAEERIRGATFYAAYCDEVNLYPLSVWMQLQARLSLPGAICLCNCNPDSPYHWFYKEVLRNNNPNMSKKVWKFKMEDNLSLTDEYKRQLAAQYSGVFKKRFIDGEWCVADGKIYDSFDSNIHVMNAFQLVQTFPENVREYFVGCDQGTSTTCSWSFFCKNKQTGIHYKIGEYYYDAKGEKVQKDDSQYLADFKRCLSIFIPEKFQKNLPVYGDPAASSWDAMLTNAGYNFRHAKNDVIEGIRFVLKLLNERRLFFDNGCKRTREEYDSYSWDSKAQERGEDKPLKKFDHACDSDRYALYTHNRNADTGIYRIRRM